MRLLAVPEAAEMLGDSPSQLRYKIFHDVDEIDSRCVVRIGRSVRLRQDRLLELIEAKTGAKPFRFSPAWQEARLRAERKRQASLKRKRGTNPALTGR